MLLSLPSVALAIAAWFSSSLADVVSACLTSFFQLFLCF